jgi:hypothetical protein
VTKWVIGFAVWLVLVLGAAAAIWLQEGNLVGGGFVAKEVCSCVHLGGRSFEACRADLAALPGIDWIAAAPLPDGAGVSAGLPGFTPRVARAAPERGCTLEP